MAAAVLAGLWLVVVGDRRIWPAIAAFAVAAISPILGPLAAAALAAASVAMWIRRKGRTANAGNPVDDSSCEALVAEMVTLGLSAGLTFPAAAEAAHDAIPCEASEILMRSIRRRDDGFSRTPGEGGLYAVVRRALTTGAPLQPAVSGYAAALRSEERLRRLTAIRRLPVKLLFPLALLILPGFLLLTVGPAVLGSLERLGL